MRYFLTFIFTLVFTAPSFAELKVHITKGSYDPLPIAIPDFHGNDKTKNLASQITNIIRANLLRSALFRTVDEEDFIQDTNTDALNPEFADWRVIGADALIHGNVTMDDKNNIKAEFFLWDVLAEKQITGLSFSGKITSWRRIAHMISDVIYKRMTGESGYFDSRIVYIAETGPETRRQKRLAIMDQDGANHRYLSDGKYIVLTPRFSPSLQKITYMAYLNDEPRVYILDLETGKHELLGSFTGMTFAPRFSPDGKHIVFSLARGGNSDIYTMNLKKQENPPPDIWPRD